MAKKRFGICVVGAGALGARHAESWAAIEGTDVVWVVDVDEVRAKSLADRFGCPSSTDYRDGVAASGVDIVSVCTPTFLHHGVAMYAMQHGKHVLSEKPIALTLADADEMIEAAEKYDVHLGIGLMRRFGSQLPKIEELVQFGRIGRPLVFRGITTNEIRPKRLMHAKNANGGPVIDFCVHLFDSWTRIFKSRPVEVSGKGMIFGEGKPELGGVKPLAIDTASLIVTYESGDVAHLNISWGLPAGIETKGSYQDLIGPDGVIQIHTNQLVVDEGAERVETIELPAVDPFLEELSQFVEEVRNGGPQLVATGSEAREALKLSLAALRSIESGKPVQLSSGPR